MPVRLDPGDIERLGPAAKARILGALEKPQASNMVPDEHENSISRSPPPPVAAVAPRSANAPAGLHEQGLPPRSARRRQGAAGVRGATVAAVRRHPWAAAVGGAAVLLAVLIAHVAATKPSPSPYAVKNTRCAVAGQVALEPTQAACAALQKATGAKAMPQVVTSAPKPTAPAQAAPQQPARTAARKTVAPAPAPQPKTVAQQPAKAAAPAPKPTARPTPVPAKVQVQPAPASSSGKIDGLPAGFHAYLCRVEHRTDGFCQGG